MCVSTCVCFWIRIWPWDRNFFLKISLLDFTLQRGWLTNEWPKLGRKSYFFPCVQWWDSWEQRLTPVLREGLRLHSAFCGINSFTCPHGRGYSQTRLPSKCSPAAGIPELLSAHRCLAQAACLHLQVCSPTCLLERENNRWVDTRPGPPFGSEFRPVPCDTGSSLPSPAHDMHILGSGVWIRVRSWVLASACNSSGGVLCALVEDLLKMTEELRGSKLVVHFTGRQHQHSIHLINNSHRHRWKQLLSGGYWLPSDPPVVFRNF